MTRSKWFDWSKYCWGIDVSHYRPTLDWSLLKAAGISFMIAKASESTDYQDPAFPVHVQNAYDYDVPAEAYHFNDPTYYPVYNPATTPPAKDAQLQNFLRAVKNKRIYGTILDHERWWQSYDQWFKARRSEIPWSEVRTVDKAWNARSAQVLSDRIIDALHLPHALYSSLSFIKSWSPGTLAYCDKYDNYTAYYPYSPTVVAVNSWAEFFEKYGPPDVLRYDTDGDKKPEDHDGPPWWANKAALLWQLTGDKFQMPGVQDGRKINLTTDINLCRMTQAQLWQKLGFTPRHVTPPPPEDGGVDAGALAEVVAMLDELKLHTDAIQTTTTAIRAKIQ
jgi:hypothetical protein